LVRPSIPAAGEIWWLDLHPSSGREQRGRHAGLILSAWQFNRATGFAYIAPITTVGNASRHNNFAVSLTGIGTETTGVIQLDQVEFMDWRGRNGERSKDVVPVTLMQEVLERFGPIFGLGILEAEDGP
jgi:mRNA-degrading endonuclease toxin of MazEF toxin-antitoxin module